MCVLPMCLSMFVSLCAHLSGLCGFVSMGVFDWLHICVWVMDFVNFQNHFCVSIISVALLILHESYSSRLH